MTYQRELGFLYEQIWEPIPKTHAPPQHIPAVEEFSPQEVPWWLTHGIAFGLGLLIGLPIGREMIKTALGIGEAEIRRRIEAAKARRGL